MYSETYLPIVVVVSPRHIVWPSLCGSACGVQRAAQGDGCVCGGRMRCRGDNGGLQSWHVSCKCRVGRSVGKCAPWSQVSTTRVPLMIWPFPGGLAWRLGGSRACAFHQPDFGSHSLVSVQNFDKKRRASVFITVYGIY
jgi:hypothetical protein